MKKLSLFILLCILYIKSFAQSTIITPGNSSPNITTTSTVSGILPTKITTIQRDAIMNPEEGLLIYNITSHCLEVFRGSGWYNLCSNSFTSSKFNKLLGGSSNELSAFGDGNTTIINNTSDGGYILAGSTMSSLNGDITNTNHGAYDIWVVKLDINGNIQWSKLIGGNQDDIVYAVQQTSDNGYVIAGTSWSSGNGDITATTHGYSDFLVVKLNASGDVLWNKLYGGSSLDDLRNLQQTSDSGYILVGYSLSSNNNDVTNTNHGIKDFWIVKINSSGAITWNKLLGGDQSDQPFSVQQTNDGGYIISGVSDTNNNGSFNNPNNGYYDFCVIKLDNTGTTSWQKFYGTIKYDDGYSIQQTSDGGYIIVGVTQSASAPANNFGVDSDAKIIKTDASGNVLWSRVIAGTGNDFAVAAKITPEGGYIFVGYSNSSNSGDITDTNHGSYDFWVVKLNSSGNTVLNRLLGGSGDDRAYSIQLTNDGGYIIAGSSTSSASGDVLNTNHGNTDIWVIRMDNNGNIY